MSRTREQQLLQASFCHAKRPPPWLGPSRAHAHVWPPAHSPPLCSSQEACESVLTHAHPNHKVVPTHRHTKGSCGTHTELSHAMSLSPTHTHTQAVYGPVCRDVMAQTCAGCPHTPMSTLEMARGQGLPTHTCRPRPSIVQELRLGPLAL